MAGIFVFPPPGAIKSIQQGTITTSSGSGTATVAAVSISSYVLSYRGQSPGNSTESFARLTLTNATTITATSADAGSNTTIGYQLTEYY